MKSFIYTIAEHTSRNGHTIKTCRIFQIKRGTPVYLGGGSDTFTDDFQLCMMLMEARKLLPKRAFVKHVHTGGHQFCREYMLRDIGIANINKL